MTHPKGLSTLFLTEMWERFSYYGMRALLVLYLVNSVELPRAEALEIYATYTALVYLTPILGGYLADRWLGHRQSVIIGAVVMSLGHFAMAFPNLLYYALGLLILGNGFFKPNISTILGGLYQEDDPRRDGGFTIFYMGINLGAFMAPLVCGTLAEYYGWHYGFAAAGVGMVFGLLIFIVGFRQTCPRGQAVHISTVLLVVLTALLTVWVVVDAWSIIHVWWESLSILTRVLIVLLVIISLAYLPSAWELWRKREVIRRPGAMGREEWHRVMAIAIMAFFVIFFWMGFEQAGGTMNLFADQYTDRRFFGWEFHASYFQSLNPLLILILAPIFSTMWVKWDTSSRALSVVTKQGLGMVLLGLGFVIMAVAQQQAELHGKVGPLWLVAVYLLHTSGELFLSPIGLSMVTKLAPSQLVALMMGLWFSAMAVASYLAGTLEAILRQFDVPLYWFLVLSSIGAGLILILLNPLLQRLMHGRA
ncbi:MAG: peptide MFS transporter [Gammaproteobacteria bacterium]|nr:peptide MFS transporter [Gammaproteobacteria bacterium]